MNIKNEAREKGILLCSTLLVILCVYLGFQYLLPIFLPAIIAFLIATCIRPIMNFLHQRLRIPNGIGAGVTLVLILALLGSLLSYLIYKLSYQVTNLLDLFPSLQNNFMARFYSLCNGCDSLLGLRAGTVVGYFDFNDWNLANYLKNEIMPRLPLQTLQVFVWVVGAFGGALIIFVSSVLLAKDYDEYKKIFTSSIFYKDIHKITGKLADAGLAYLRAQAIIIMVIAALCVTGLVLVKNEYALLIGILIAIFDAFPVFGSGFILIPWAVLSLLRGNIVHAAILLTIYLGCVLVRQFLEPKLIGDRIGIRPVFTLLSIYIGIQVYGVAGVILGPITLVLVKTVMEVMKEKMSFCKSA